MFVGECKEEKISLMESFWQNSNNYNILKSSAYIRVYLLVRNVWG